MLGFSVVDVKEGCSGAKPCAKLRPEKQLGAFLPAEGESNEGESKSLLLGRLLSCRLLDIPGLQQVPAKLSGYVPGAPVPLFQEGIPLVGEKLWLSSGLPVLLLRRLIDGLSSGATTLLLRRLRAGEPAGELVRLP